MNDPHAIRVNVPGALIKAMVLPVLVVIGVCTVRAEPQSAQTEGNPATIRVVRAAAAKTGGERIHAAYRAYLAGDLDAARAGYAETLQAYPDNRDAMLGLAACAVREGDIRSAVSMYRRIIEAFPQDVLSRVALIGLQKDRQDEPVIRELLLKQPGKPFFHVTLGQLLAAQSRWPEAQQAFSEAHRIDPASPVYSLNLAISLDRMGQRRKALNYYRTTLKLVEQGNSDLDIRPVIKRIQSLRRP